MVLHKTPLRERKIGDNRLFCRSATIQQRSPISESKSTEWITPETGLKEGTIKYSYAGKNVSKTIDLHGYSLYTYDSNNHLTRRTFYDDDNEQSGYIDFFYDAKGNLIKRLHYDTSQGKSQLSTTTEYSYDNKKNPFRLFGLTTLPGRNTNPNNIVREIYTIHFTVPGFSNEPSVSEYTYKYNRDGYPISCGESIYTYY